MILRDLGTRYTDLLPYIQDLPARIRALILVPESRGNIAARMPQP
ncbi:hypothetical protein ACFFX1_22710 [Dactylosporangium sucinum]|uniref:Uncharacterized protein n=1 Tax=Dactylosporangium sucinum TaxID=1424081 RepID=A0A917UCP9_9ACTN|nr:hypothetical protein [Dactylosporangium sucinum]GGM82531.1 hypothetical protein GCM10007977_100010 [Dactylosporangium sucinum]